MNVQNIPRDDKVIKRAIIPKLGALSFFDYKAIEPRLFGYYAAKMGHPELAAMVREGVDPYTAVARLIEDAESVSDQERQHWKVFFLSLMYGGGIKTIQEQFQTDRKSAKSMVDKFHRNFPAVRSLQDTVGRVAKRRGYIVGIDGRHLHPEPYGEHKMLNKLIQGSAAGVMKKGIREVHGWLQSDLDGQGEPTQSQIISVVHDELQIDGPVHELPMLNEWVPRLMAQWPEVQAVLPIEVDHEITTTSWADKEEYVG